MTDEALLKFGTVQVAKADVAGDRKQLRLNLLDGVFNKHELGMLIEFLRAKQETLDPVGKVPHANRFRNATPAFVISRLQNTLCTVPHRLQLNAVSS